jgi:hypothetical protein
VDRPKKGADAAERRSRWQSMAIPTGGFNSLGTRAANILIWACTTVVWLSLGIIALTSVFLKFFWYDRLGREAPWAREGLEDANS